MSLKPIKPSVSSVAPPAFAYIDWAGRKVLIELAWVSERGERGAAGRNLWAGTAPSSEEVPTHTQADGQADEAAPTPAREDVPGDASPGAPLLIFLHEGLGSVAMWRDFPERLCRALGVRGLVYSRPGYGGSTPRAEGEAWQPDFMHRQAHEVLPALLRALRIDAARTPLWLLGHSDGGSIALLAAAHRALPLAAVAVMAPHILVEELSLRSIAKAREAYLHGGLRERLARYHDSVDSAFWGWNDVWLMAAFRAWSIEDEIGRIACPLVALQGLDDEYGTLEQIHGIARRVPHTRLVELPACGHSPHRDQPEAVIDALSRFFAQVQGSGTRNGGGRGPR